MSADALQRALGNLRDRQESYARILALYQAEAAADAEHIRSMDRMVLDLRQENEQLRTPWWRRPVS